MRATGIEAAARPGDRAAPLHRLSDPPQRDPPVASPRLPLLPLAYAEPQQVVQRICRPRRPVIRAWER